MRAADSTCGYQKFLSGKLHEGADHGIDPDFMPTELFDFQAELTAWAIRKGRAAIFADCGLGKTLMQLVWAQNIVRKTGGRVLILTPLAVSLQTAHEGEKFGIPCYRSRDGSMGEPIVITNYERLHLFRPEDFSGAVCDESSILKSFDGQRRQEITDFMRKMPYRLLCTATAAPNDYIELGTSSEALGYLGHVDMLNRFFKNDQNNSAQRRRYGEAPKWRFRGHAELPFWRWVCSWARAVRRPSDLGFSDEAFELPPLHEVRHVIAPQSLPDGYLFAPVAHGLREQREERRRTIRERCEKVAELASHKEQCLVWCHLNDEGDLLESIIPDSLQVRGSHSSELKEERLMAFADGDIRVLVTKPKIGAWGLNFQNCHRIALFPSHSYEQYYQGVRRCWRFGQKHRVRVDIVATEGEQEVLSNLQRKAAAADEMFSRLVAEMNNALSVRREETAVITEEVPPWLSSIST